MPSSSCRRPHLFRERLPALFFSQSSAVRPFFDTGDVSGVSVFAETSGHDRFARVQSLGRPVS